MTGARRAPGDGLQAERTALAWTRTSLGALVNGVLVLVRDLPHHAGWLRFVPLALAVALALLTAVIARRRQRALAADRTPARAPRGEVHLLGGCVLALVVTTALVLVPWGPSPVGR